MIRYRLLCNKGHHFEAWFRNSTAYDRQAKRRLVECPSCGSTTVEKTLMAPAVNTRRSKSAKTSAETMPVAQTTGESDGRRTAIEREMAQLMRKLRAEVEKNAENVGREFADEARRIHYEEAPVRGIYGEATSDEVKALREEGIDFYPLPRLPEEQN
jgi:hypothetical protein